VRHTAQPPGALRAWKCSSMRGQCGALHSPTPGSPARMECSMRGRCAALHSPAQPYQQAFKQACCMNHTCGWCASSKVPGGTLSRIGQPSYDSGQLVLLVVLLLLWLPSYYSVLFVQHSSVYSYRGTHHQCSSGSYQGTCRLLLCVPLSVEAA